MRRQGSPLIPSTRTIRLHAGRTATRTLSPDRLSPEQAAEAIRHAPVEIGYGFNARGRQVFRQVGDENRIMRFRADDLIRLKNGMFVHNHPPYPDFPENDPRRRAGSFSATDLIFAYEVGLARIVAVTKERTYSVARPPGGFFLDPHQIEEEYRDLIVRVRERRIAEQVAGRMTAADAVSSGMLADEVMDALGPFYVYWWEEVG